MSYDLTGDANNDSSERFNLDLDANDSLQYIDTEQYLTKSSSSLSSTKIADVSKLNLPLKDIY